MPAIQVTTEVHEIPFQDTVHTYLSLKDYFGEHEVYLLESMAGPSKDAQSTFLGFQPLLKMVFRGTSVQLSGRAALVEQVRTGALAAGLLQGGNRELALGERKQLWAFLRFVQSQFSVDVPSPGDAFYFGLFGYLGYDTAWSVEKLPYQIPADDAVPDIILSVYQGLVEYNLVNQTAHLVLNQSDAWDSLSAHDIIQALEGTNRQEEIERDKLLPQRDRGAMNSDSLDASAAVEFTIERQAYEKHVEKALSYISIGDIYQVQLGNQVNIRSQVHPFTVYQRLRERNPSPYMYLVHYPELSLIGASPELFVKIQGSTITMRPIAGTCPRGATEEEDQALTNKLRLDEKEVAEHIMLVDLCRNDIGRVCSTGTLEVEELMTIESYSHVNHLVSSVEGKVEPGKDVFDIIAATFPAGTMTGAPKVRAMEIIEELENTRRGPYAGALGFIDFSGYVNMALCIRTAVYRKPGHYAIRASAGVVADSRPENEWRETFHKMGALYWAITGKEVLHESVSY